MAGERQIISEFMRKEKLVEQIMDEAERLSSGVDLEKAGNVKVVLQVATLNVMDKYSPSPRSEYFQTRNELRKK